MSNRYSHYLVLASICCVTIQAASGQSSILGTNLVVNGNAESGSAAPDGKTIVASIPNWTRGSGKANVLPYNLTGFLLLTDPAPPDHGFNYFAAAPTIGNSTLTQVINLSSGASAISAGNVKFTASAYVNSAQVQMAFQNSGGQTFSSTTLSPVNDGNQGLALQQSIGLVPTGTTQVTVTLTLMGVSSEADSLSLVLSTLVTNPGSVLGANLIANPGGEQPPNAAHPGIALYVPGWSTSNLVSVAPYGGTNWVSLTAPGPADRGVNLFWADSDEAAGLMYQDLDVSPASTMIDAGQVTFEVSAWLGGIGGDKVTLTYTFFDWSNNQLGATAQLVTPARSGVGLVEASASGTLPSGTRRVHVSVNFQNTSSAADNINFTLSAPNAPPVITGGGIVSASAFGAFSDIAPGTWIEIYGANLAPDTRGWAGSDFTNGVGPTTLDGVTVSVGGAPAYIDYISPGQINALVPSNAPTASGTVDIVVQNGNGSSDPFGIYIEPTAPGLLAPPQFIIGNKQYVAAISPDGTFALPTGAIPGVASHPASPGDVLTIYGIGFGPVTGGFTAGTIVTAQNSLSNNLSLLFGSTSAMLNYDGLAPNYTGLYQFNVVVPKVSANNAEPISFTLGNVKSTQTLYIAVQN
jgi:uncharacterized protein (TIGR03437 family)